MVFLLKSFGNFGIRISVSASSFKSALASALQKVYLKNNIFMFFLVLSYVRYKYLYLYDFLYIHSKASIGVLEKDYLNIRKHPSIGVLKK